jgi:hypothetical protein
MMKNYKITMAYKYDIALQNTNLLHVSIKNKNIIQY